MRPSINGQYRTCCKSSSIASEIQRCGYHLQRGQVLEGPLAEPALAEQAYQAAIEADPTRDEARGALIALLDAEATQVPQLTAHQVGLVSLDHHLEPGWFLAQFAH